jgi:hypothetical protein
MSKSKYIGKEFNYNSINDITKYELYSINMKLKGYKLKDFRMYNIDNRIKVFALFELKGED